MLRIFRKIFGSEKKSVKHEINMQKRQIKNQKNQKISTNQINRFPDVVASALNVCRLFVEVIAVVF